MGLKTQSAIISIKTKVGSEELFLSETISFEEGDSDKVIRLLKKKKFIELHIESLIMFRSIGIISESRLDDDMEVLSKALYDVKQALKS